MRLNNRLLNVLAILIFPLLLMVTQINSEASQSRFPIQSTVQGNEQQKLSYSLSSQSDFDQSSFDLNLHEVPNRFKIVSETPELRIRYQRSPLFRVWAFICILPFIPVLIVYFLAGLVTAWEEGIWSYIRLFPGEVIHFVIFIMFLGWLVIGGLWMVFGSVEYQASRESLAIAHQSLGFTQTQRVSSPMIQSFAIEKQHSSYGTQFKLKVITNSHDETQLHSDSAVDDVVWLGVVLADFYNTPFQVNH